MAPPRRTFVTRVLRRPSVGVHQNRVVTILGGDSVDDTFTTFTTANATPTADGVTATTLTFTAKDANDDAVAGVSVTYA